MAQRRGWLTEYELGYNRKLRKESKFTKADKKKKKVEFDKTPNGMVIKATEHLKIEEYTSPHECPNKQSMTDDSSYASDMKSMQSSGSFSSPGADKVVTELDLQPLRDVAYENYSHVESKLKNAKSVNYRQTGIGSKGGHIARLLGAPGPLNGHRVIQEKDRLMCIDNIMKNHEPPKPYIPLVLPEWCSRFVNNSCLASDEDKDKKSKFSRRDVRQALSQCTRTHADQRTMEGECGLDNIDGASSVGSFTPVVVLPFSPIRCSRMDDSDANKLMLNAEYMWHCMMAELRKAAAHIHYKDLVELAGLHHPSTTVINVMSYFNALLGITPSWETSRKYLFKELIPLLKFIEGVEPLVLPQKRLVKATALRDDRLVGLSPQSLMLHSRPMAKIFTMNNRRVEKVKKNNELLSAQLSRMKLQDKDHPVYAGNTSNSSTANELPHLTIPTEICTEHPPYSLPMSDITDDFGASSHVSAGILTPLLTERSSVKTGIWQDKDKHGKHLEAIKPHKEMSMVPALKVELFEQMSQDEQLIETLRKYEPPHITAENGSVNRARSPQNVIDHHHRTISKISLKKSEYDIEYVPHEKYHAEWLQTHANRSKVDVLKELDHDILEAYNHEKAPSIRLDGTSCLSAHEQVKNVLVESFRFREGEYDIFADSYDSDHDGEMSERRDAGEDEDGGKSVDADVEPQADTPLEGDDTEEEHVSNEVLKEETAMLYSGMFRTSSSSFKAPVGVVTVYEKKEAEPIEVTKPDEEAEAGCSALAADGTAASAAAAADEEDYEDEGYGDDQFE